MSSIDPTKDQTVQVQTIMDLPSVQQAELIVDQFAHISNLYQPLKSEDIQLPSFENSLPVPLFEPYQMFQKLAKMRKKASTVCGDIPWRIISEYSVELSFFLSNIYNSATQDGIWPNIWKYEYGKVRNSTSVIISSLCFIRSSSSKEKDKLKISLSLI